MEHQANNEILQNSNFINGIIQDEFYSLPELSIEEFNQEYQAIHEELAQYLAQQLLESTRHDEALNYERYQQLNEIQTEQQAFIYDPNNNSMYICAVCKRYVYRVNGSRVLCERPNCIDIDLGVNLQLKRNIQNPDFRLEDLMNQIMKMLQEHKDSCEAIGKECCSEADHIKVKLGSLSEYGFIDEEELQKSGDSFALLMICDNCTFIDFLSSS